MKRLEVALALLLIASGSWAEGESHDRIQNVVLVHGAWADGSGWRDVYEVLQRRGFNVTVVQNPVTSLADDVAATTRVLERLQGPCVLVGHSYGGAVITEAGNHPAVETLVYVAAFMPDAGESVLQIPLSTPPLPLQPTADGFFFLDPAQFRDRFAADLGKKLVAFMAASQAPIGGAAFTTPISQAAWRSKRTWALIAADDQIIGAAAERQMATRAGATIVEVDASHAVYVSHPGAVADLIERAAAQ